MRYPKINKQPRREVQVPQFSGGLNLRDSVSGVRDNQMTDCVNMWYKEGMLKTRPSFTTNENMFSKIEYVPDEWYDNVYVADLQVHDTVKKGDAVLVSFVDCYGSYEHGNWQTGIKFLWQYPDKTVDAGYIEVEILRDYICKSNKELEAAIKKSSRIIFEKEGYIYLFFNDNGYFEVYKSQIEDNLNWDYVNSEEYYIPTVYAHCLATNGGSNFTATQFESYNSLCDGYKMVYSLYNAVDDSHIMRYRLADIDLNKNYTIKATIIGPKGEKYVHTAVYEGFKVVTEKESPDGRYMTLVFEDNWQGIIFTKTSLGDYQNDVVKLNEKDNYAEDNLIITIIPKYCYENEKRTKIFEMTQSIWFGGAANGINGGSRLFLGGNKNDKSLIMWSALDNPLYFPENNYAYVGDKSQGVTAFGRQGENLIIFKEKSTYYSFYAVNNVTADDLINQTVIDYESNSVYFPIIMLNANIGCDCPNTVQLCRNRLVWSNSDGNVYTLYSNNQYNERTIYKVSDMINVALKQENDLKNAVSCDFEGHYLLCAGDKIYVMDYNSYGYQYASSFSKNEDSNVQIPWYIWEFDNSGYVGKLLVIDNKPMLINSFQKNNGIITVFSVLGEDKNTDNDKFLIVNQQDQLTIIDKKIKSAIQSKMFDFSAAGYLKNIDRVGITFGNNGGAPIDISFVTDKGSESNTVTLVGSFVNKQDTAFITAKNFFPTLRAVRTFGLKIECSGPLYINGLTLQYRLLGGIK